MKHEPIYHLTQSGITLDDAIALRRISMTLHRWHELECGDSNRWQSWCIVRGAKRDGDFHYDNGGKPYMERHGNLVNETWYESIIDRERGALKRLEKIMKKYPNLAYYVQGDPRGAALYILHKATTPQPYEQFYTRGIAVYK